MTAQLWVSLALGAFGTVGAVLGWLSTKGKTKSDAKSAMDARIDARVKEQLEGAWSEIQSLKSSVTELEEKDRLKSTAFARILRAIAKQWPDEHGPDLDPSDITLIEDTIPPTWLRPRHRPPGGTT